MQMPKVIGVLATAFMEVMVLAHIHLVTVCMGMMDTVHIHLVTVCMEMMGIVPTHLEIAPMGMMATVPTHLGIAHMVAMVRPALTLAILCTAIDHRKAEQIKSWLAHRRKPGQVCFF
jgi:hypothetical protein